MDDSGRAILRAIQIRNLQVTLRTAHVQLDEVTQLIMTKPQPKLVSAPTREHPSPRKSNAIPRQSLAAAVVERLRDKILHGELREGEQLRQDAIAAEFQISRIPVREALSHLAAEGLITIVANRGAVVSALSPDEIMQLFETRAVLECYMLRKAIANFTAKDFQAAEEILQHFEESLENDADVKSWGQWNWAFHSALYAPANRPVMLSFLKTLNNNCDRYTRLHLVFTRDLHIAGKAHQELLDACRTKNPDIASDALWKHITTAGEYLKEFIQRHREQHS
jgi:DNA-binding GntR family transcriptional regulator